MFAFISIIFVVTILISIFIFVKHRIKTKNIFDGVSKQIEKELTTENKTET